MLTREDVDGFVEKLSRHADEIHGDDDIMNGVVRHLIRSIEADATQLWFYGNALKQRKSSPIKYGLSNTDLKRLDLV